MCINLGHTKLISCFWSYESLKNDQVTKTKWKENGVQTAKCIVEGEVWGQDNCVSKVPKYGW